MQACSLKACCFPQIPIPDGNVLCPIMLVQTVVKRAVALSCYPPCASMLMENMPLMHDIDALCPLPLLILCCASPL